MALLFLFLCLSFLASRSCSLPPVTARAAACVCPLARLFSLVSVRKQGKRGVTFRLSVSLCDVAFCCFFGQHTSQRGRLPSRAFFLARKKTFPFFTLLPPTFFARQNSNRRRCSTGPPPTPIPLNKHKTRDQVFPTVEQHDMSGNAQHPVYPFQPRLLFLEGHHPITRQKKKPTTTTTTLFLSLPPINYI